MAIDRGKKNEPQRSPDELIEELDEKVDLLRIRYVQFFQGTEKKEPAQPRAIVQRLVRDLRRINLRPGPRFKFQNLASRFAILEEQWNRKLKQIEEGKFKPHLFKLYLHQYGAAAPARALTSVAAVMRGAAPASASATASVSAPAPTPAEVDASLIDLHARFIAARQETGESTAGVTVEALRATIEKQIPLVREQHRCEDVEFKVVIRAGKATLKVVPKGGAREPGSS